MTDHISNIEDKKAQTDLGVFGARIFEGALEESDGDLVKAYLVTVAFFRGMFGTNNDDLKDDE
jgi:hypothetical protein